VVSTAAGATDFGHRRHRNRDAEHRREPLGQNLRTRGRVGLRQHLQAALHRRRHLQRRRRAIAPRHQTFAATHLVGPQPLHLRLHLAVRHHGPQRRRPAEPLPHQLQHPVEHQRLAVGGLEAQPKGLGTKGRFNVVERADHHV
jgi:hypothetical protein